MSSGYLQMYIYRLKKAQRDEFLGIQEKAAQTYRKHGAGGEEMFHLHDGSSKYRLSGTSQLLLSPAFRNVRGEFGQ